jgi:lipoprotein NlpI
MEKMRIPATAIAALVLVVLARPVARAEAHDGSACGPEGLGQTIAGCARVESVRLDPKAPAAPHDRAAGGQAKNDLEQIIVYYDAAIRSDPKDDDAYFHRGIANLYAGSLPQALADLERASELDPTYAYYALWIDIVDKRGNPASQFAPDRRFTQAISHIDMAKWPAPVIRLFLGQATSAAVLAAANDPDLRKKRGQVCEANFYIGELALRQGAKSAAAGLFTQAAADCPREFAEGPAAAAELAALRRAPVAGD